MTIEPIAHIHSDYKSKFGIPRQSGLAPASVAVLELTAEYSTADALRGLEGFSHLWLIWGFSENTGSEWSPTVRPPRLGGNERVGVFATRSPFRPNNLGLSAVKLIRLDVDSPAKPLIYVSGADLMDGTPIYDIKPYVPYADSIADAADGFASQPELDKLKVELPPDIAAKIPAEKLAALLQCLALDPRPAYQDDPERVYGMDFAGLNIKFIVTAGVLKIIQVSGLLSFHEKRK
jgi:tRNA-Thr(GGU) m(6)t(6)A37 methyltransferase TsaA